MPVSAVCEFGFRRRDPGDVQRCAKVRHCQPQGTYHILSESFNHCQAVPTTHHKLLTYLPTHPPTNHQPPIPQQSPPINHYPTFTNRSATPMDHALFV